MAESASPDGLVVKGPATGISASNESVTTISATVERMFTRALEWANANPVEFFSVLLFAGYGLNLRHRSKIAIAGLKLDYDHQRKLVREPNPPIARSPSSPERGTPK